MCIWFFGRKILFVICHLNKNVLVCRARAFPTDSCPSVWLGYMHVFGGILTAAAAHQVSAKFACKWSLNRSFGPEKTTRETNESPPASNECGIVVVAPCISNSYFIHTVMVCSFGGQQHTYNMYNAKQYYTPHMFIASLNGATTRMINSSFLYIWWTSYNSVHVGVIKFFFFFVLPCSKYPFSIVMRTLHIVRCFGTLVRNIKKISEWLCVCDSKTVFRQTNSASAFRWLKVVKFKSFERIWNRALILLRVIIHLPGNMYLLAECTRTCAKIYDNVMGLLN